MIQALIHEGRVEVQDPIPASWEGQTVQIVPLSPMLQCRISKSV